MKFFSLIFCVYLFTLVLKPCSDNGECNFQDANREISASSDHSDHEGTSENCSPFCICACCGQSITTIFYLSTFYNFNPVVEEVFPIYYTSFFSEVYLSIWQPPKIS